MSFCLNGHVALVTGSTRGLGKAMAFTLGQAGAKVALNYYNNRENAESVFAEFLEQGNQGILCRADVTNPTEIQSMCTQIKQELGPVDILVINATCDQPAVPIEEYSWDDYQLMVDYFIKSPFLLTQACVAEMKAKGWGRIINIGSDAFQLGCPNFSAYVAAKGGQAGFTRSMAMELAPYGINVNIISPGWIPVERHANVPHKDRAAHFAKVPAKHWGGPKEVAAAVLYFASAESSFVIGQTLCVNGGLTPM
ncbi:MAG: SDR family oxidoreductase [bacterium]